MAELFELDGSKQMRVRIGSVTDDYGNPAEVDGAFAWTVAPDGIGALDLSAGDRDVLFVPNGTATQAGVLEGRADADLSGEVVPLLAVVQFVVKAGRASVVSLNVTVEDKPAPALAEPPSEPTPPA